MEGDIPPDPSGRVEGPQGTCHEDEHIPCNLFCRCGPLRTHPWRFLGTSLYGNGVGLVCSAQKKYEQDAWKGSMKKIGKLLAAVIGLIVVVLLLSPVISYVIDIAFSVFMKD